MVDNPSPDCSGSEELHQSNSQDEPGTHRRPKIAIREWIDLNDFSNPENVDEVEQLYDKKQKLKIFKARVAPILPPPAIITRL